jgi:uncharacterized protein YndB with AHSA1/START domain
VAKNETIKGADEFRFKCKHNGARAREFACFERITTAGFSRVQGAATCCTIHQFDFRPGGRWELTLHGTDGTDYENEYFAVEIVEPERIVISHPDPAHDFQVIVTLAEAGENKTRLTWRQVFSSREHFDQVKSFVVEANEQVLDRLEAEVARIP